MQTRGCLSFRISWPIFQSQHALICLPVPNRGQWKPGVSARMSKKPEKANCADLCVTSLPTTCLLRLLTDLSVCSPPIAVQSLSVANRCAGLGGPSGRAGVSCNHVKHWLCWLKKNASPATACWIVRFGIFIYLFIFCLNKTLTMELKFDRQKPNWRAALLIFYLIHSDEQDNMKTPLVIFPNTVKLLPGAGLLYQWILTEIFTDQTKINRRPEEIWKFTFWTTGLTHSWKGY